MTDRSISPLGNPRASEVRALASGRTNPGKNRLCRSWSHGDRDGREPCQHGASRHRLCPPTGSNGRAHWARPQTHSGIRQPLRLRGRHQHAAGRRRRSRCRTRARRPRHRGSRIGIEARRNSSFHEHNQHIRRGFPRGGARPSRAGVRRGAGLWKSGCRQGAPVVHCRRRGAIRCRALPAALSTVSDKRHLSSAPSLRRQTSSSCSAI